METIKQLFIKYKEIIMYLIMGGGTTVVNWVVYSLMVMFCHPGNNLTGPLHISASTIDVFVANVVSWVLAVTFAYITNKLFVFESYSWNPKFVLKELSLFLSARIATGLIEIFGVPFLVSHGFNQAIFGLEGSVCKITMSFLVVLLNYVFSKLVIFKKDKTEACIIVFRWIFFAIYLFFNIQFFYKIHLIFLLFGTISNKVYVAFFRIIQ